VDWFGQTLGVTDFVQLNDAPVESVDAGLLRATSYGRMSPELLITATDPLEPTPDPPRLLAVEHERVVPHVKHTGTFPLVASVTTPAGTTEYTTDPVSDGIIATAYEAVPPQEI
jgi:hypothetical protein